MTKKEIVKQISEELGLTQLKTKEIVQKTFDAIVETLLTEKRIELRNFGVFEVKQRKARKARNPRTGERVDVPPKNVVTFKPPAAAADTTLKSCDPGRVVTVPPAWAAGLVPRRSPTPRGARGGRDAAV